MVSGISSVGGLSPMDATSIAVSASDLFMACLQNFIEKFDKTATSEQEEQQKEMAKGLIEAADSDNSGAVSKEELSKVDLGNNKDLQAFKNDLLNHFDTYDKNKDGELSIDELEDALKTKDFSLKELSEMAEAMKQNENTPPKAASTAAFEAVLLKL